MRKLELEEVKKIQQEILDYVDDFCQKNDINYWLDAGSLIGAIRHKGYIPWDDDLDIGMLRNDYEKFIKEFNKASDIYKVTNVELDSSALYFVSKIMDTRTTLYEPDEKGIKNCVNIDILVYDNAPDENKATEKMFKKRDFYHRCCFIKNYRAFTKATFKRKILRFFIRCGKVSLIIFPKDYFYKKIFKNSKKYANVQTESVGNFCGITKFTCNKRVFESFVDVEFEGKEYKAPVGYDEWLTRYYGDYMKLPPIEKQKTHHRYVAYKNE